MNVKTKRTKAMNANRIAKRARNKARNESIIGFNSVTRQRNHARAHKRDGQTIAL